MSVCVRQGPQLLWADSRRSFFRRGRCDRNIVPVCTVCQSVREGIVPEIEDSGILCSLPASVCFVLVELETKTTKAGLLRIHLWRLQSGLYLDAHTVHINAVPISKQVNTVHIKSIACRSDTSLTEQRSHIGQRELESYIRRESSNLSCCAVGRSIDHSFIHSFVGADTQTVSFRRNTYQNNHSPAEPSHPPPPTHQFPRKESFRKDSPV